MSSNFYTQDWMRGYSGFFIFHPSLRELWSNSSRKERSTAQETEPFELPLLGFTSGEVGRGRMAAGTTTSIFLQLVRLLPQSLVLGLRGLILFNTSRTPPKWRAYCSYWERRRQLKWRVRASVAWEFPFGNSYPTIEGSNPESTRRNALS